MNSDQTSLDLFQRTCILGPKYVPPEEEEIEILSAESAEAMCEEEYCVEEEPLDVKALMMELECMKRRIQKMQLKLKMVDMEKCPTEPCMDYEVLLTCSENKEICNLQKNNFKLQCQIKELVRCLKVAKEQIEDLRIRMCEKSRDILELQKLVASLISWRDELSHEFGMCIERFEYLKHVKAEWSDIEQKLNALQVDYCKMQESFAPKECYAKDKTQILNQMNKINVLYKEMLDLHTSHFNTLEKRLELANIPPIISFTQEFDSNASLMSGMTNVPTAVLTMHTSSSAQNPK